MIQIGNFFFKYRNLIFPVFGLMIFIPSPPLFMEETFGENYYHIPLYAGIAVAFLGQTIRAFTIGLKYIVRGGKNKKVYAEDLVTDGIFHHCRNPLYVGNILMLFGVGIISNSLLFLVIVVPLFCFIYQAIVLAEEAFLAKKFGGPYQQYTKEVDRWTPKVRGLFNTINHMEFNWKRYIVNEYNTIYLLALSIIIVVYTFHPPLRMIPWSEKGLQFAIAFLTISIAYLFARYLKKSGRLVPKT